MRIRTGKRSTPEAVKKAVTAKKAVENPTGKTAGKKPGKKTAGKKPGKKPAPKPGYRPVDKRWPISLKYGAPGDYIAGHHTGTDFACPEGTPVLCPHDGQVTAVLNSPSDYGQYVMIQGNGGKRAWLFAHLSRVMVAPGHHVTKGMVIAFSGNTGNTTGPHLHAEERVPPFGYRQCHKPTAWSES